VFIKNSLLQLLTLQEENSISGLLPKTQKDLPFLPKTTKRCRSTTRITSKTFLEVRKLPVLRSNQPCSRSQSPPILQKFSAITLNHNPPPFLQVSRKHPSKKEKNDYSSPCSK
jgi:hypothetical protein